MASLGHVAIGLAAATVYDDNRPRRWSTMLYWSVLSLLPDIDVIGFAFGVEYADPWGHRGATHSFAIALIGGLAASVVARAFRRPAVTTALFAAAVLASHPLLDMMTDGGLGCALFWPIDPTRYFAPWRPIPVAPIGSAFFSRAGAFVALIELLLFAPVLIAVRPAAKGARAVLAVSVALSLATAWLMTSRDTVRETIIGILVREHTAYTPGFSDDSFRHITPRQTDTSVRQSLGKPYGESWFYPPRHQPFQSAAVTSVAAFGGECISVRFHEDIVVAAAGTTACGKVGVRVGLERRNVERILGKPHEACWQYTWSPTGRPYRLRMVCFLNGTVDSLVWRWAGSYLE
jgi:inner membrane protein